MYVTTVTPPKSEVDGAPVEYRLHRDNCKAMNGSQRSLEDMLEENPEAVLAAADHPHSVCSPSKAVQVSVRTQAQAVIDANNKKEKTVANKTATKTAAAKPAAKTAAAKPEAPKAPRTLAPTEGTQRCEKCGKELPLTSFPTRAAKAGEAPVRGKVCRADLKAAAEAKKAAASK